MNSIKKLRSRRGVMFVEVVIVVAILAIMLGLAMPNLLFQAEDIKITELNNNARAVAIAVQSKLYGMKNAGTLDNSLFQAFNDKAIYVYDHDSSDVKDEDKELKYISNFKCSDGVEDMVAFSKSVVFSGAITDVELLNKGKIVVVYNSETAAVYEVFYSEKEFNFDIKGNNFFPSPQLHYLKNNRIGLYQGANAPAPISRPSLPNFTANWIYDDELRLQLKMVGEPDPGLINKPLGLEVYALIPAQTGSGWDEIMIYGEGWFKTDYKTEHAGTIKADHPFTLQNIKDSDGTLDFALDSMITERANYGAAKEHLRHQTNPNAISALEDILYPRESINNWFAPLVNPYLTVWEREYDKYEARLHSNADVMKYVNIDQTMMLRVKIHVLSNNVKNSAKTSNAELYMFDDANYDPVDIKSWDISPYFHTISDNHSQVTLTSVRDLSNLNYIFTSKNTTITSAVLRDDITSQQLYEKFVKVRYALMPKDEVAWPKDQNGNPVPWNYANWDSLNIDTMNIKRDTPFTLSGKKLDEEGCYSIENVAGGGRDFNLGGLFGYAENCTFKDLNIINPKTWRNHFKTEFLQYDDNHKLTGISADSGMSGSLVAVAVNCTFENVHAYIDYTQTLKIETNGAATSDSGARQLLNITSNRISGVVAGGLVGLAIGTKAKPTSFINCAASVPVFSEVYFGLSSCVYAGGLIGATANGNWACKPGMWSDTISSGTSDGNVTVKDSFASGIIQRLTRVGGGLIAQINKNTPEVSGCYSSVRWETLSPVAYGTFEGDNANFYVPQIEITVPVSANVEAKFSLKGDVLSLRNTDTVKNGIPCTYKQLPEKLKESSSITWVDAANTLQWWWINNNVSMGEKY